MTAKYAAKKWKNRTTSSYGGGKDSFGEALALSPGSTQFGTEDDDPVFRRYEEGLAAIKAKNKANQYGVTHTEQIHVGWDQHQIVRHTDNKSYEALSPSMQRLAGNSVLKARREALGATVHQPSGTVAIGRYPSPLTDALQFKQLDEFYFPDGHPVLVIDGDPMFDYLIDVGEHLLPRFDRSIVASPHEFKQSLERI